MAEKVSEVPNSKYHSLFFVLKETRQNGNCKGTKKEEETSECFFSRQNLEACELVASLLLLSSVYSSSYAELMKKKKKKGRSVKVSLCLIRALE